MQPEFARALFERSDPASCVQDATQSIFVQIEVDYINADATDGTIVIGGNLLVKWQDWRLRFNSTSVGGCPNVVTFTDTTSVWTPKLFIQQASSVVFGGGDFGGGFGEIMHVNHEGHVSWIRQAAITLRCHMYFGNIPFDTQECPIVVGVFGELGERIEIDWSPATSPRALTNSLIVRTLRMSEWRLLNVTQEPISEQLEIEGVEHTTFAAQQNISQVQVILRLARHSQLYVNSYVASSIFFVLMSYAGFWLDLHGKPGRVGARVSLATITVLVVNNLRNAAKSELPPASYPMWLTDFMFVSLLFCLVAFFETVAVNFGLACDEYCRDPSHRHHQDGPERMEDAHQHAHAHTDVDPKRKASRASLTTAFTEADRGKERPSLTLITGRAASDRPGLKGMILWRLMQASGRVFKDLDYLMRWLFLLGYLLSLLIMSLLVGQYTPPHH